MNAPITTDLTVSHQGINIDIESIAPLRAFGPESYDVANMTIIATVQSPAAQSYRLVLAADIESGTSATVRVVSATDDRFKVSANFRRVLKSEAELIRPVLVKAGIALDPNVDERDQLKAYAAHYKIADIEVPAGSQVLRIHASQKLIPIDGNPRRYRFTMYAPQLSLAPTSNVRLGATVVFPLDFTATIDPPLVEPMPGQPTATLIGGSDNQSQIGLQKAYGWAFQADPKITISYTY